MSEVVADMLLCGRRIALSAWVPSHCQKLASSWTAESRYWLEIFITPAVLYVDDYFIIACYLVELVETYLHRKALDADRQMETFMERADRRPKINDKCHTDTFLNLGFGSPAALIYQISSHLTPGVKHWQWYMWNHAIHIFHLQLLFLERGLWDERKRAVSTVSAQ